LAALASPGRQAGSACALSGAGYGPVLRPALGGCAPAEPHPGRGDAGQRKGLKAGVSFVVLWALPSCAHQRRSGRHGHVLLWRTPGRERLLPVWWLLLGTLAVRAARLN